MITRSIDVIIPTQAGAKRGRLLIRAIDSVVSQEHIRAVPVVVVNGDQYDRTVLATLAARTDIRLIRVQQPGLFNARRVGFEAVRTEFFATLDDDDAFLPGALSRRLGVIASDKTIDWVVSNGIFVRPEGEVPFIPDVDAARRDPFGTLLEYCWLSSAGNLFRTASFQGSLFDAVRSMDLTYIAFGMLASGRRLAFLDEPTFRYFYYPDSLSKDDCYTLPAAEAIRAMMALPVPSWVRAQLARKHRMAMHDVADHYRRKGDRRKAWVAHLRSLAGLREFLRYAAFTRKLLPMSGPGCLVPLPPSR